MKALLTSLLLLLFVVVAAPGLSGCATPRDEVANGGGGD